MEYPSGLPIANTVCPGLRSSESPSASVGKFFALILIIARSFSRSIPRIASGSKDFHWQNEP